MQIEQRRLVTALLSCGQGVKHISHCITVLYSVLRLFTVSQNIMLLHLMFSYTPMGHQLSKISHVRLKPNTTKQPCLLEMTFIYTSSFLIMCCKKCYETTFF